MKLILHVLLVTLCLCATGHAYQNRKYNLRWVTKDPVLPIYIEKATNSHETTDYKWFKYPQEVFLDEEDNYESKYLFSQSLNTTTLYILEYDLRTHEQLGTYEPIAIRLRTNAYDMVDTHIQKSASEPTYLYTLAYVESHSIEVTQDAKDLHYFCNVSVLVANSKQHSMNEASLRLIERSLSIKMDFLSNTQSFLRGRSGAERQHNHVDWSKFNGRKLNKEMSVSFTNRSMHSSDMTHRVRRNPAKSSSFLQVNSI
jgi:hypothetical protein